MLSAVIIDYLLKVVPILMLHILYRKQNTDIIQERYRTAKLVFHFVYGLLLSALAYSFYLFSPLAYGIIRLPTSSNDNSSTGLPISKISTETGGEMSEYVDYSNERSMQSLRWMDSWEF